MNMNLLDRAIAAIAPRAAVRRLAARVALSRSEALMRSYDAAKTGRRTDGWYTTGGSANAEIGPVAARIRNRARDLVRNNPHAARAVSVIVSNVIGNGIKPRLLADQRDQSKRALETFSAWMEESDVEGQLTWCGQQKLTMRTVAESGEALILWKPQSGRLRLTVPIQAQVLEPDHLDTYKDQVSRNGSGQIVQGVEFDATGRRVAYWLYPEHPGDAYLPAGRRFGPRLQSERVEAKWVDHVFDPLRPGQVRGAPWLAPVVLKLRDIDDYDDAELVRKKVEACLSAFVKKVNPDDPMGPSITQEEDSRQIETFAPGQVQYLNVGEDVTFSAPAASEDYAEFLTVQLHAVAAGAGVTYEDLTGDLSKVNFTSMRVGKLAFYALVDQWQELMFIPQACRSAWWRVGALADLQGFPGSWPAAEWGRPGRPYIDPREVRARIDEIRSGLSTLPREIASKGGDPVKTLEEIQAFNELLDEMGVTLDSDPRQAGRTGAAHPDSTQKELDDGQEKDDEAAA